jgi:predicted dehydrogenase
MDEPKRILIVGAGSIGLKHIRAFNALDPAPKLVTIDPRPEARARAEELGAEALDATWESLDLRNFDGVVICAPAPWHVPYSIRCLKEGVPVLSEKPLSHSWEGVEELLEIASRPDAPPSGVAYVRRYHPAHERAKEFLDSGELGQMLCLRITAGQPFTKYRPDYRQIYYASREMGGGCLLDCASHFIDLAQWYLGPIGSMCGHLAHLALEGVEVEDTVSLSFDFSETGYLGSLHVNQYQPLNESRIELCGAEGVLRIIEPDFTCRIWRKDSEDWEEVPLPSADYADALRRQAAAFLAAIDGGPPLRTSFADAAHTLRLCLSLLESTGG